MEKVSMKFAISIFLVIISMMSNTTIRNVDAKRLLTEENDKILLDLPHEEGLQKVVTQQYIHCKKGCIIRCVPNPFIIECYCQC
ncbi:unnamed protein product [Cochlearia groenlandica]